MQSAAVRAPCFDCTANGPRRARRGPIRQRARAIAHPRRPSNARTRRRGSPDNRGGQRAARATAAGGAQRRAGPLQRGGLESQHGAPEYELQAWKRLCALAPSASEAIQAAGWTCAGAVPAGSIPRELHSLHTKVRMLPTYWQSNPRAPASEKADRSIVPALCKLQGGTLPRSLSSKQPGSAHQLTGSQNGPPCQELRLPRHRSSGRVPQERGARAGVLQVRPKGRHRAIQPFACRPGACTARVHTKDACRLPHLPAYARRVDRYSKNDIIVSPSILSADFSRLGDEVRDERWELGPAVRVACKAVSRAGPGHRRTIGQEKTFELGCRRPGPRSITGEVRVGPRQHLAARITEPAAQGRLSALLRSGGAAPGLPLEPARRGALLAARRAAHSAPVRARRAGPRVSVRCPHAHRHRACFTTRMHPAHPPRVCPPDPPCGAQNMLRRSRALPTRRPPSGACH